MVSGIVFIPILLSKTGLITQSEAQYLAFVSILVCSISTLIQVIRIGKIGSGYVLFMGTSGAFMACSIDAIEKGGLALVATLAILSAPLEILTAYFFRYLRKIFTPAVGGVVIMLVAVTIVPISMQLWVGPPGISRAESIDNLLIGVVTIMIIVLCLIFGNRSIRTWSPIIGLAVGYITAAALGQLEMTHLEAAEWIGLPPNEWPGITLQLNASYWPVAIAFAIATISGTIETVGDAVAVQKVSMRDFRKIDYAVVQGALYADGIGNFLSGLVGTTPNTTYSSNIAILELNGVASRRVGLYGALFLGVLAFCPKATALILDIPAPALGAVTFVLMGLLFVTGIKVATLEGMNSDTVLLVSIAFWGGYAAQNRLFFPELIPPNWQPLVGNGIVTGSLIAVCLAVLIQFRPRARKKLKIPTTPVGLQRLQKFIDTLGQHHHLSSKTVHNIQLCCEEVFVHLCNAESPDGSRREVSFQINMEEEVVLVEVTDHSFAEDVDLPRIPANLDTDSPENLEHLGLFLVSKIAENVNHMQISGYNYIGFEIPCGQAPEKQP